MKKVIALLFVSFLVIGVVFSQEETGEEGVEIKELDEMKVCYSLHFGSFDKISPAIYSLFEWIEDKEYQTKGVPGAVYYTSPYLYKLEENLWEVIMPISEEGVEPFSEGNMGVRIVYPKKVLYAIHEGSYESCGKTYTMIMDYAKENDVIIQGAPIEFYLNDPAENAPEDLLTEIMIPFVSKDMLIDKSE
jgi:AraC family transcriptional regulator